MATTTRVAEFLQQALLAAQPRSAAVALVGAGASAGDAATLLGSARCDIAAARELQAVADLLPAPLALQGAFAPTREEAVSAAAALMRLGFCTRSCVAAFAGDGGQLAAVSVRADGTAGAALSLQRMSSDEEWLKSRRLLRCALSVRLEVVEDGTDALLAGTRRLVAQLEAGAAFLASSGARSALLLPKNPAPLSDALGPSSNASGAVLCTPVVDTSAGSACVGPVFAYQPLAPQRGGGSEDASTSVQAVTLKLDVLCFAHADCTVQWAAAALRQALVAQAQAAHRVLAEQGKALPVTAYHFLPPGLAHHVTVLYPTLASDAELNDAKLQPLRQRLHGVLGLPANRPLLRPANALASAAQADSEEPGGTVPRLRNVHLGLAAPDIGGITALVDGLYEYCHYMQDKFNDSGWGCAYRSLQTICSWFRLQKYTSKPIPSHKVIQTVLARLGDKPPSFVGSTNWIGAIELSYILDDYLGVTSKILTVNRGADIPSHARELAAHFSSVGTPVMIGGGVLAYTLLGVRFNEQTGEAAFLILDPHYTGGEDLKKIQQGTWIGWKRLGDNAAAGGPLFVEDAFYNFLLPQRPNTV